MKNGARSTNTLFCATGPLRDETFLLFTRRPCPSVRIVWVRRFISRGIYQVERLKYILHSYFVQNIEEPVKFYCIRRKDVVVPSKVASRRYHVGSDRIKPATFKRSLELALPRVPSLSLRLSQLMNVHFYQRLSRMDTNTHNSSLSVWLDCRDSEDWTATGCTFHFQSRSLSDSVILVLLYSLLGYACSSLIMTDHHRMSYI